MSYQIRWSNGQTEDVQSYEQAIERVREDLGTEAKIGHSGDLQDGGDRTLFWTDALEAHDDDGQHAAGQILRG